MSNLVVLCLSSHYQIVLLPHYELVPPPVSIGYVQIISNDLHELLLDWCHPSLSRMSSFRTWSLLMLPQIHRSMCILATLSYWTCRLFSTDLSKSICYKTHQVPNCSSRQTVDKERYYQPNRVPKKYQIPLDCLISKTNAPTVSFYTCSRSSVSYFDGSHLVVPLRSTQCLLHSCGYTSHRCHSCGCSYHGLYVTQKK
jgi:hypothetical protein